MIYNANPANRDNYLTTEKYNSSSNSIGDTSPLEGKLYDIFQAPRMAYVKPEEECNKTSL